MMRTLLAAASLFVCVIIAGSARAQSPQCLFTPTPGTSNQLCASTAFVQRAFGLPPAQLIIAPGGTGTAGACCGFSYYATTEFSSTPEQDGGFIIVPTFGNMVNNNRFYSAYIAQIGAASPVPAGKAGEIAAFEANINTNQTTTDVPGGGFTGHGFGASIASHGGAEYHGLDVALTVDTVAGNQVGVDIFTNKNIAGGITWNYTAGAQGSQPSDVAYMISTQNFTHGFYANGNTIDTVAKITFASSSGTTPTPGQGDFLIDGTTGDLFRITGGGTANTTGGFLLYLSPTNPDTTSQLLVRDNPTNNAGLMTLSGTGNFNIAGGFSTGANTGVSCAAGISATTGRSVLGIVTHC